MALVADGPGGKSRRREPSRKEANALVHRRESLVLRDSLSFVGFTLLGVLVIINIWHMFDLAEGNRLLIIQYYTYIHVNITNMKHTYSMLHKMSSPSKLSHTCPITFSCSPTAIMYMGTTLKYYYKHLLPSHPKPASI